MQASPEQGMMADLIEQNLMQRLQCIGHVFESLNEVGVMAVKTKDRHPFFNEARIYRDFENAIGVAVSFFKSVPARVALSFSHDFERHKNMLESYGFQYVEDTLGMALQLGNLTIDANDTQKVTFKEIHSKKELELWLEPVIASFRLRGFEKQALQYFSLCKGYQHFMLMEDQHPITAASLIYAHGCAGIYYLCTRPEARKKGRGTLLLQHLMHYAKNRHLNALTLHASHVGATLYLKNAFLPYAKQAVFIKF